jgi:hypothetical protein
MQPVPRQPLPYFPSPVPPRQPGVPQQFTGLGMGSSPQPLPGGGGGAYPAGGMIPTVAPQQMQRMPQPYQPWPYMTFAGLPPFIPLPRFQQQPQLQQEAAMPRQQAPQMTPQAPQPQIRPTVQPRPFRQ